MREPTPIFLSYSSFHNLVKDRTSRDGFIHFWRPLDRPRNQRRLPLHVVRLLKTLASRPSHNVSIPMLAVSLFPCDVDLQAYTIEYYWKLRLGLEQTTTARRYRRVSEEERRLIQRLREQGYSIYEIARRLNRPVSTIYYVVKRLGE